MTLQRILVGLDGSPLAESVLGAVRALAGRLGAEVTLLHVAHVPESIRAAADVTIDGAVARERHEAERYLRRIARELREAGIAVRTSVAVGDAALEIMKSADRDDSDLLALATHGRSGVWRWLHGSVADAVLHGTTRPLLLLRPSVTTPPTGDVERLVVPLDGSAVAEEALALARDLAQRLHVPLELLQVVEVASLVFTADPASQLLFDHTRMLEMMLGGAKAYLEDVADRERRHGVRVETTVSAGGVAPTIAFHGDRPGSLVVLGSHGRTGWRAAVLGNVARRVVALAEGPVLVVHPRAAAAS